MSATSFAAVVMLAPYGKIKEVALWVRVRAPVNVRTRTAPAAIVPNAVIVVVPVTETALLVAAAMFVVDALAFLF